MAKVRATMHNGRGTKLQRFQSPAQRQGLRYHPCRAHQSNAGAEKSLFHRGSGRNGE